jgi:Ig-like domain from next to BRCA1 gene/Putative peptidoglycan binding domain
MAREKRSITLSAILILTLILLGCSLSGTPSTTTPAADQPTEVTQAMPEAATAAPATSTPEPPAEISPTDTVASATPTAEGCTFGASYMADITIPDDTVLASGAAFVKTWRLKNTGTCEWEPGMKLVYVSGDPLGGPATIDVPVVALNAPIDVSVNFVAPATPGTYRSNWRMQNPDGTQFGSTIYVQIIVPEPVVAGATDTPPAPAAAEWKSYHVGDKGAGVYALQYLLRAEGNTLDADGVFGPKTELAVKAFQTARGIKPDGSVGAQTWATLVKGHLVRSGNTGDDVRAVQYLLSQAYGYADVAVDGKFGSKTNSAVQDFQTKHGLQVDGIVGSNTWKALIGNL